MKCVKFNTQSRYSSLLDLQTQTEKMCNDGFQGFYRTNFFLFTSIYFGLNVTSLLKEWMRINVKIIDVIAQLHFLRRCREHNIFPQHIQRINCCIVFRNKKYIRKQKLAIRPLLFHRRGKYIAGELIS